MLFPFRERLTVSNFKYTDFFVEIKSCYDFMKLPQRQTIGNFSALQEADVYFGHFTIVIQAAGSDWRKAKIPIPAAPLGGISASLRQATGYFGIFATALRAAAPHFRFNFALIRFLSFLLFEFIPRCPEGRDLRYASTSSGEFKFKNRLLKPCMKIFMD